MELKHIKIFVTAAELLNFSKTAERSFISQPSVTKYIQTLEKELGEPLFYRSNQKIELTKFGKAFLPFARELVEKEQQSLDALDRFRKGQEYAYLNIGVDSTLFVSPPEVFYLKLMRTIKRFRQTRPNVTFQVRYADPVELEAMLDSNQINLVLQLYPVAEIRGIEQKKFSYMRMDSCRNYLAVAEDADLSGGVEGILSRVQCYSFEGLPVPQSTNSSIATHYGVKLAPHGHHHWTGLYLDILLSNGLRATVIPENMRHIAEACGLVLLELEDFDMTSAMFGLWKSGQMEDELIRSFLTMMKAEYDPKGYLSES